MMIGISESKPSQKTDKAGGAGSRKVMWAEKECLAILPTVTNANSRMIVLARFGGSFFA